MTIEKIMKEENETILNWYFFQIRNSFLFEKNTEKLESLLKKMNLIYYNLNK